MIVVDSNIIAYLYLPSDYTGLAEKLLENDPHWVAPILWRSELRNVLAGYLRRKILNFHQIYAIQKEAEELLRDREFELESNDVFQLVARSECSAYDCEFVALALRLKCKLVTMDKKILVNFPDLTVALTDFAH
jgi:predicted nucleic acid-binding protein